MLVKDDQNVEKLYLYTELPYYVLITAYLAKLLYIYIYIQLPKYMCWKFQYIYIYIQMLCSVFVLYIKFRYIY